MASKHVRLVMENVITLFVCNEVRHDAIASICNGSFALCYAFLMQHLRPATATAYGGNGRKAPLLSRHACIHPILVIAATPIHQRKEAGRRITPQKYLRPDLSSRLSTADYIQSTV